MNHNATPIYSGRIRSYLIAYHRNSRHVFGIRAPHSFVMWYIARRDYLPFIAVALCVIMTSFTVGQYLFP